MLIDNTKEYDEIWSKVTEKLKFSPSCSYRGHSLDVPLPFQIDEKYSVYGIEAMTDEQVDYLTDTIREIFVKITRNNQRIYALDWQHSAFIYNPRNILEQQSCVIKDERYYGGEYYADFPSFFPDGDYYFFIEEYFEFGYLGHPWRQEIWIFGESLIKEIDKVYIKLGWNKIV